MGLDQYLYKKTYVKQWSHQKPEDRNEVIVKKGGKIVEGIKPERISEVVEEVACWRKANQIHKWFVDNVQNGEDDCAEHYVDDSKLKELLALTEQILANSKLVKGKVENGQRATANGWEPIMEDGKYIKDPKVAKKLLPVAEGFFFGATNYDEWYLDQIRYTHDTIKALLAEGLHGDYYYDSSW